MTRDPAKHKLYLKIVNGTSEEKPMSIALHGATGIQPDAKLVTLSGRSPNATNSIDNPTAVVPVESQITNAGPHFEHTFAPYSINVLELSYE